MTHALVTEAHGAGFPFAEVQEAAAALDEGGAGAVFLSAADFTGVLRLCKQRRLFNLIFSISCKLFLICPFFTGFYFPISCFTVAGAGLEVLHGLTEGVTLSVVTAAVVHTRRVVFSVGGRRTLAAYAFMNKRKKNLI